MRSKTEQNAADVLINVAEHLLVPLSDSERIIEEKELSDLIINCLPGIFYLQDHTGKYLRWNKNFEKATGYSKEEIEQMHPLNFFDPADHDKMKSATRKVYKEGYNETEAELLTKSGGRLLYYFNGLSVTYEGKLSLLGTGIDLTERERSQRVIEKSEKKYHSLFEQASDPILVSDFKGNLTDVNGSFCRLFGYTKKQLLKMNIRSMVCPVELKDRPLQNDLLMQGKHIFSDRAMIHKDGSLIETEANLKKFGDDRIMGIVRDVSAQRKMQREMESERLELKIQEQKKITRAVIKAQERERNVIGRELQNNVNQLLASARMTLSTVKSIASGKKDVVDKSVRLIDSVIYEIRALSKKHLTPVKGFILKEEILTLIKTMEEGMGFKINLQYEMPENSELLYDLRLNIYRIIQEQLDNVYTHASASRVTIKMVAVESDLLHLAIYDNGIGFEVGIKKSGLGIVNIINRVESFNGKVTFETNSGSGSKLDMYIPMIFQ
jgi:PAS domain S-box-containing protein